MPILDTCHAYVIPAIERGYQYERCVWLVLDKDGSWYKTYEAIETKNPIYNER